MRNLTLPIVAVLACAASLQAATRTFSYPVIVLSAESNTIPLKVTASSTNITWRATNVVEVIIGTNIVLKVPATNVSSGFRSSVGIQSGSFTNQNVYQFTNTFATAFSNAPVVTISTSTTNAFAAVYSVTPSNFVGGISSSNLTTNTWIAIGQALLTP